MLIYCCSISYITHIWLYTYSSKVYEVAPSLFMVDVRKAAGDTLEYHKVTLLYAVQNLQIFNLRSNQVFHPFDPDYFLQFYKNLCTKIDHIIWRPKEGMPSPALLGPMTFWSSFRYEPNEISIYINDKSFLDKGLQRFMLRSTLLFNDSGS